VFEFRAKWPSDYDAAVDGVLVEVHVDASIGDLLEAWVRFASACGYATRSIQDAIIEFAVEYEADRPKEVDEP